MLRISRLPLWTIAGAVCPRSFCRSVQTVNEGAAERLRTAKEAIKTADAVCFDVDSTVITEEGIDVLARFLGKYEEVSELTRSAMGGSMQFRDALEARLNLIRPSKDDIEACLKDHSPKLNPGLKELVGKLRDNVGADVFLVSGGFRLMIEPVRQELDIPPENVFANTIEFKDDGSYKGFDEGEPTSRSGGKPDVVSQLIKEYGYKTVVMIGDGATDMEARPPAHAFIGYGGVTVRKEVKAGADWFVEDFQDILNEIPE